MLGQHEPKSSCVVQVRECAKLANESVAAGMCVVIGLQSTGEANTNQTRDEEGDILDDFVSAPKKILQVFIKRHFPTGSCDMEPHELDLLQHQVCSARSARIYSASALSIDGKI